MFPAITSGSSGSAMDRLAKRARLEWVDPARRSANWGLLRAVGMFLTGIIVARNFGDAFNV